MPPLSASCRVRIAVTDMNDNPPAFVRPAFSFAVPENSDADLPLGRVEGTKNKSLIGTVIFAKSRTLRVAHARNVRLKNT